MSISLSLLFFYLAMIIPTGRIALFFISSIFVAPLAYERELGLSIIVYIGTSLLAFLIVANKMMMIPYVLLFGHYGIGKVLAERKFKRLVAFIVKLIYFNICLAGCLIIGMELLINRELIDAIPIWLLVIIAQVVFVIYDFAYSLVIDIYFKRIRKFLFK